MNKKVLSIIGAFLGGLIFSIPWVLVYVFGNYIMSILAFLIATGAYIFYKKFGGEVTKKTSITIGVISLIIVTFLVFIVLPLALMVSEGHGFNFAYLGVLYSDSKFVSAIISDYVVSVIFTLLGISRVVAAINKDAYGVINDSEYLEEDDEEKVIKELKKVYDYYKAYDKKTAIPDSVLFSNIKVKNPNRLKSNYIKRGVIVLASANKTYFDEQAILNLEKASSNYKKFKRRTFRIILFSVIFLAFAILAALVSVDDELTYKTYSYDDISIKLPDYFTKDDTVKDEDGYAYFEGYQSNNKIGVEALADAINMYSISLSINPSASAYTCRARCKARFNNDFGDAILDCNKAIEIEPEYYRAYFVKGDINALDIENYQGGLTDLNIALSLVSEKENKADILGIRGIVYWRMYLQTNDDLYAAKAIADYNEAYKLTNYQIYNDRIKEMSDYIKNKL